MVGIVVGYRDVLLFWNHQRIRTDSHCDFLLFPRRSLCFNMVSFPEHVYEEQMLQYMQDIPLGKHTRILPFGVHTIFLDIFHSIPLSRRAGAMGISPLQTSRKVL